jgi:hypothetical protein
MVKMETFHIIPAGFIGFNILFNIIFALFTAIIAAYSMRIYWLSKEKESKNFGLSFIFLSASYIFLFLLNTIFLSAISGDLRRLDFEDIMGIKNTLVMLYSISFILGFSTLFYTTTKIKSTTLYILLTLLSVIALGFSSDRSLVLYSIASIFLALIVIFYIKVYACNRNNNTLIFGISMFLLLISNIFMILSGDYFMPSAYVIAVLIALAAYGIIFICLLKIINHGKKKK